MERTQNEIYNILVRHIDGECSEEESLFIKQRIQSDPKLKNEYDLLIELNGIVLKSFPYTIDSKPDAGFEQLKTKLESPAKTKFYNPWLRVAQYTAAAMLIFVAGWYFINSSKNEFSSYAKGLTYKTGHNELQTVRLNDGSIITLNQNSRLLVDKSYNSKNRLVELYGEAFFEVTQNINKPFIVKTKQTFTKVIGTSFEIESRNNQRVFLKLHKGKVQFITANSTTILAPLETIDFSPITKTIKKQKVKNLTKANWATGLCFKNTSLKNILHQMDVLYNVKIMASPVIENERYTVSFTGLPLSETLKLLSALTDCRLIKNGTHYLLIP